MPQPNVNPDGTVQVAPSTQSAFGQASNGAPPPMSPQGQAAAAHPGFAEALMQMISQLGQALNPNKERAPRRTEEAINAADPNPNSLGNQISQ
jgi:hypothetical protein